MKSFMKIQLLLTIVISTLLGVGKSGNIAGHILNSKTSEVLMGANILLEGYEIGGTTDSDGAFRIYNIPEGKHNLIISYIGYQTKKISDVVVTENEITKLDITLNSTVLKMKSIVFEVEANRTSSTYLLSSQKDASNIQDGISSDQASRNGDSNASDAAKRIVGLSVIDDQTIVIRGLSGRYTQTEINNLPMPSPNADKSSVPLNLFPLQIIESITVRKTFTPDMPGTFAGGNINIKTKAYPDNRAFKLNFSTSQKSSIVSANNYMMMESSNNFFGFDHKRQLPDIIPSDIKLSEWNSELETDPIKRKEILGNAGKSFNTGFTQSYKNPTPSISTDITLGNKYNISNNLEWGFFTNSTFSNSCSFIDEEYNKYSITNNGFEQESGFNNQKSSYNTNLASLVSTGIKLYDSHKISLKYIYTHRSEQKAQISHGFANQFDNGVFLKSFYSEETINNITFNGKHDFKNFLNSKIEWLYALGKSNLFQPDERGINLRKKNNETLGQYLQMDIYSWSAATRKYTEGNDNNVNFDIKYSTFFKDRFGDKYKINFGSRVQSKNRAFSSRSFYHKYANQWTSLPLPQEITVFQNEMMIGSTFVDSNYFSIDENNNVNPGLILVEDTKGSDAYKANESINAQYFTINMPLSMGILRQMRKINLIAGIRREDYNLELQPYDPVTGEKFVSNITHDTLFSEIDEIKYLPSVNLIGKFKNDFNIKASYSRTVARAEFREIAPFEYQAFYGGDILIGYPHLQTTDIYNYDLRFEYYRKAGEILAINLFKKNFTNPIEISLIETSGKIYKTYQNAKSANSQGVEFDSRVNLDFIPLTYGVITSSFNLSWSQTEVNVKDSISMFTGINLKNESTSKKRSLQGQSDFVINAGLYYNNLKGFNISLSYNFFSKRIAAIGVNGIPNEYEFPNHLMNLTASQKWNNIKFSLKMKNMLNSKIKFGIEDKGNNQIIYTRLFSPGLSFSFGISYGL
ncbi:MAG: TonB-dependent receptor [Candidatus Marinimicrobia bacterium]|nr:TonB-dependent receptor [Candidatus Neomarinimicrobiota bacterium]